MKARPPAVPVARLATLRREMTELLASAPLTAREISAALGIPERGVCSHLEHIRRSLHRQGRQLQVLPPVCHHCGFDFPGRQRLERPGKCPRCRSQSLAEPRFSVR
jgi:hypothetical protein